MAYSFTPNEDWRHQRDGVRHQLENWKNSDSFMASTMSQIPEQQPPRSGYDLWNNDPVHSAGSLSFDRDLNFAFTQRQSSQLDMFTSRHYSNAGPSVFSSNGPAFYLQATTPPVYQYDFPPSSSTPSRPLTLSHIPTLDRRAEDLQYGHLDPGIARESWEMLDYLPPGFLKRSPIEIEAFRRLSRAAQLDENQRRLIKCGWTDQSGLQGCTVVMSARDMRKHIEKFHNVPRPRRSEPPRVCRWVDCGSSERDLYKHIGIVHFGLQQIPCDYCDREFSRTDQLKAHMKSCGT
ncbi:hypothetical protein C8J56DRAFT_1140325 [Mycena floridula]|nr:hypothetical protein C8J56DRAFT_1140325 [Mycena floridula]